MDKKRKEYIDSLWMDTLFGKWVLAAAAGRNEEAERIGDIILESYPYTLENSERLLCEKLDAAMEYPGEMEDYLAELDKENYDLVGYMISQDIFGEVWGKV